MLDINLTLPVMMVMFLLFALAMNGIFFAPVTGALEARKAHIAGARAQAEESIRQADALQADYQARLKVAQGQSHEAIHQAMSDAEGKRLALVEGVRLEVQSEIAAARDAIRVEKDLAIASLTHEVGAFSELIKRKALAPSAALSPTGRNV